MSAQAYPVTAWSTVNGLGRSTRDVMARLRQGLPGVSKPPPETPFATVCGRHSLASGWIAGGYLGELFEAERPPSVENLEPYTRMVRRAIGPRLFAGHSLLQFSKTPLLDWLIRFGSFRPVRSLLTRALASA